MSRGLIETTTTALPPPASRNRRSKPRPVMRRSLMFAIPFGLCGAVLPAIAAAEITLPDCATLAAWAGSADFRARQTLNPSTTFGFAEAFIGEEMVALYGKTGPEFTEADVAQARQGAKDCARQVDKAGAKVLAGLERIYGRDLGATLKAIAKAEGQLEAGLAAFAAAPDGLDKLRAITGLRAMEIWDRDGYQAAVRHMSRSFGKVVDGVVRPLASLPQAAVAERVLPAVEPHYARSRDMAMTEVGQQIAAIEASERSLQRYDREIGKIVKPLEGLLPEAERAALADAVAARRTAIEQELIAAGLEKLAAAPPGAPSLGMIENAASGSLTRVLSPEAAEGFRDTLRQRRQAVALAIVETVPESVQGLTALPQIATALGTSKADLVGEAEQAALQAAIAEKRVAAGATVTQELLAAIAATPVETGAFAALDRSADARLLPLLATEDADAVRRAADERRNAIGDALFDLVTDELDDMDDSEKSLAIIDTALLPGINGWPASAGAQKTRFLDAVVTKRNAILAEITETQLGSLGGRRYADRSGATTLEFGDDGKAYFTQAGGQTIVAPYEEDGELRVLVTLPQATVVFTREGRWLVGGPVQLQRMDDKQ
ncbi:MAG: hypothetical protein WD767_18400 [Alphaproteobacteria bacterium]